MSKDIVKKDKGEVAGRNGRDVEIVDDTPNPFPFVSFRYSYKEISSDGVNTRVRAKKKSFENGKFESEEFEGTLPGNVYSNMVGGMQNLIADQLKALLKPFSMFLPPDSKKNK